MPHPSWTRAVKLRSVHDERLVHWYSGRGLGVVMFEDDGLGAVKVRSMKRYHRVVRVLKNRITLVRSLKVF